MSDSIWIQVRFTLTQNGQTLNDALFYSQDQYNALTPQQLQADKQARFDSWQKAINTPPPVETPDQQFTDVTNQIDALNTQLDQLTQTQSDLAVKADPALVASLAPSLSVQTQGGQSEQTVTKA